MWPGPSRCPEPGQLHPRPVVLGMDRVSRRAAGTLGLGTLQALHPARASVTKGAVKGSESRGGRSPRRMGTAPAKQPRARRPCPQSELSLSAPGSWRGARPRPLFSVPLKRRARLCGFHSLSTAERERIKSPSRLFSRGRGCDSPSFRIYEAFVRGGRAGAAAPLPG